MVHVKVLTITKYRKSAEIGESERSKSYSVKFVHLLKRYKTYLSVLNIIRLTYMHKHIRVLFNCPLYIYMYYEDCTQSTLKIILKIVQGEIGQNDLSLGWVLKAVSVSVAGQFAQ